MRGYTLPQLTHFSDTGSSTGFRRELQLLQQGFPFFSTHGLSSIFFPLLRMRYNPSVVHLHEPREVGNRCLTAVVTTYEFGSNANLPRWCEPTARKASAASSSLKVLLRCTSNGPASTIPLSFVTAAPSMFPL